jgi:hypothetical protein
MAWGLEFNININLCADVLAIATAYFSGRVSYDRGGEVEPAALNVWLIRSQIIDCHCHGHGHHPKKKPI